jgi:tetratricopeptide (TPR) repeat protein
MHCYMALIDASPNTVDCRLGGLCGCGARYCGIKCLVAASQAHKAVCENIQLALQDLAKSRFRATKNTNQAALKWAGSVQIELLRADLLVAASDVVDSLANSAKIARTAEAFDLAHKFAQRALSLAAKGSLSEAMALFSLGNVTLDVSKYDTALAHYEAALKIRKSLLGDNHVDVAVTLNNLSSVYQRLGRLNEALAMSSSALEIYSKAPGDNQKSIVVCHHNMGNNLNEQGKHNEALVHYSIGLEIASKMDGETAMAADFLINIGNTLMDQNKLDEAMEKFVSALRTFEKAKLDSTVALCHHNIGTVLMKQGKLDAALEHARKSLAISQRRLSHEHAECGKSHYLVGEILTRSGKFAEAVDEYENALRIRKNAYGEMTLPVADVYEGKAMCFFKLDKWREAVTFYEATIHIRTVLGTGNTVLPKAFLAVAEERLKAERSSAAASK